jgi:hypothetical protein
MAVVREIVGFFISLIGGGSAFFVRRPAFMATQISYEKTADFIRAVKRRHFARLTRKNILVYLPVGIIGLLGVIGSLHSGKSGGGFWLLVGIFVLWPVLWVLHYSATGYIRLAGPAPRFTARIEPESITITSDKASSTLLWSQVTAMWRFPDLVFIFWDKKTDLDHAIALPTSSLGTDLSRFIEERVREHGGRVA